MQDLRKAAIAATSMSVLTFALALFSHSFGWPIRIDRFQSVVVMLVGVGAGICGVAFWCTYITVCSLRKSTTELVNRVTQETKMLHRAIATAMDEYGNARAIDAVLANERRHARNEHPSENTADLTSKAANVTQLHKRQ